MHAFRFSHVRFSRAGRPLLMAGLALVLAMPNPAAAQFTKAYKFLESVKKKEGQEVTDALSGSGSTLVNTQDVSTGDTALHLVTARRDATWISFLLAKGADPNIRNNKGETPLVVACNLGFLEGVQLLMAGGASFNETGPTGETPLITAVHRRDIPLLRTLLKAGADPDRTDSSGRSARDYAKLDRNDTIITEINANAKAKAVGGKGTYGPSF